MVFILILLLLIISIFFQDSFIVSKISEGINDIPRIQIWVSSIYIWLDNNSVTDNYWPDNREYTSNADLQETIGENDSEENIDIEAKNVLNKKKKSYQPISKSFQGDKEEALYGHSTEV